MREPGGLRKKSCEANKQEIPIKKGRALNDQNWVSLLLILFVHDENLPSKYIPRDSPGEEL